MKKCKNCAHYHVSSQGDEWCMKKLQYTIQDSSCINHKKRWAWSSSSFVAMILAAVAFLLSLVKLIMEFNG